MFAIDEWNTILHLVANFGWTGTPNASDAISRIMLAAACYTIAGTLKLYVDDFFGACLTALLIKKNNEIVDDVIISLLGKETLAPHKDKQGRQLILVILGGWLFDLDTGTVSISEENLLKTMMHAFTVIDTHGDKVTLLELERAASMGSRYSVLCRPTMAQFTVAIYKDIALFKGNRMARRNVSDNTRVERRNSVVDSLSNTARTHSILADSRETWNPSGLTLRPPSTSASTDRWEDSSLESETCEM